VNKRFPPRAAPCCSSASGCAALIYEVVWFQLLTLVIGSSAVSLGVLSASSWAACASGSLTLQSDRGGRHPLPLRGS